MKRKLTLITLLLATALATFYSLGQDEMLKIKFDLGRNIIETARTSGIPEYSVQNVNGSIFYSRNQLPPDMPALYTRPGYELEVAPLFSFTLYADEKKRNDLAVSSVTLQLSRKEFKSHDAGRAFVNQLIEQFQKGRWKRYVRDYCPAVTGRSTLLNETGTLDRTGGCPLDPNYQFTHDEWLYMMQSTQYYEWIGDGVIAKFSVDYSDDEKGSVAYRMFLEFEEEAVQTVRLAKTMADTISSGEAKGWNTAARIATEKKDTETLNKLLEENALKRGDQVIPRE